MHATFSRYELVFLRKKRVKQTSKSLQLDLDREGDLSFRARRQQQRSFPPPAISGSFVIKNREVRKKVAAVEEGT